MSLLNLFDFQRYCLGIAGRAGLSVRWIDWDETPHTDGKTFWIPTLPPNPTMQELRRVKTAVTHEVSHEQYTDCDAPIRENIDMSGLYGALWNIIEDGRIEDLAGHDYMGDKQLFDQSDVELVGAVPEGKGRPQHYHPAVFAAWTLYLMHKNKNNPALSTYVDMAVARAPTIEGCEPILNRLLRNGWLDRYAKACTTADKEQGTEFTRLLAEELYNELSEEEKKKNPKEGKGKKKGEGGDGKKKDGKGEGEAKHGDADDGEAAGGEEETVNWEDVLKSKPMVKERDDNKGTKRKIRYEGSGSGGFECTPIRDYIIRDPIRESNHTTQAATKIVKSAAGFSNQVRTQLQIATRSRMVYGQKSGMLHKGSLYKLSVPDAGHYADRVFKKKVVNDDLDIAIFVLVDMSGSMRGSNKIEHALAAAGILSDAIGNALHIPLEIAGFTENGRAPIIFKMRDFSERTVGADELIQRVGGHIHSMCENTDGEAVMYAYDRIKQRREKRRLIITLSDGMPAGGYTRGDIAWYTKKVVEEIEKSPVEIVAIGIQTESVKHFYKNYCVLDDPHKLEASLLEVVKSRIIGGGR